MTDTGQDVAFVAGDSHTIRDTITDEGTTDPKDLTGATVRFVLDAPTDIVKDNDEVGGVTITNASGGIVEVALDPADTATLRGGQYTYQIEVTDGSDNVATVTTGTITITKDLA